MLIMFTISGGLTSHKYEVPKSSFPFKTNF